MYFKELRDLSGNAQLSYLNSIKNDFIKDILLYTYDPHKKYKVDEKINKFPIQVGTQSFTEQAWVEFKEILSYLADKASATDEDVLRLVNFISKYDEEGQIFCKMVISKDLRLNMGIKKFQKIWEDFCVEPQVQLADDEIENCKFTEGKYSRKFDGKRMYIRDNLPYSRNNNLCYIEPVQHLLEQTKQLLEIAGLNNDVILDGECLYFEDGKKENFKKAISLCQSKNRKPGCENICYVIFDMLPKETFLCKKHYVPFTQEYNIMIENLADFTKETPCYSLIPTKVANIFIARQDDEPNQLMKLSEQNNWEGLMFRNANASYEYKRTTNLLKLKEFQDIELKLIDMEEGTGKHKGRLGAFIVEYKDNTVNIGTGFSDELREKYWNNKDKYIGQYVKCKYFEQTEDANGKPSLRFPSFLAFRDINTMEEFI